MTKVEKPNIYGKLKTPGLELKEIIEKDNRGVKWAVLHTDLNHYGNTYNTTEPSNVLGVNVTSLVERLIEQNHRSGIMGHVLDVGIGSGFQWKRFAKEREIGIGRDFELDGTTLDLKSVIPDLKIRVKRVAASGIHRVFTPGKYDLIVCHYGAHGQIRQLVESAHPLLKPGGHLIISGIKRNADAVQFAYETDKKEEEIPPLPPNGHKYYDVVKEVGTGHWTEGLPSVALHYVKKVA